MKKLVVLLFLGIFCSSAFGSLLSLPSGRTLEHGQAILGASFAYPHNVYYASLGYFDLLEVTFKLTDVLTYDLSQIDPSWAGFGTFKDRAMDLKLRIIPETKLLPALSVGAQDVLGTKVFPASYAVASKQLGWLDLTLGYGTESLAGWFGGVQLKLAGDRFSLIYEANQSGLKTAPTGFYPRYSVLGARFKPAYNLQIDVATDNNQQLMVNGALAIPLDKHLFPWSKDKIFAEDIEEKDYAHVDQFAVLSKIFLYALQEGFINLAADLTPDYLSVEYENTHYFSDVKALGRMMRLAFGSAPTNVNKAYFIPKVKNVRVLIIEVDRNKYLDYMFDKISDKEFANSLVFYDPAEFKKEGAYKKPKTRQRFYRGWGLLPGLENRFGDRDNFYKARLGVDVWGYAELWNGASLYGIVKVPFYNNINAAYKNLNTRLYYGSLAQFLSLGRGLYGNVQVGFLTENFFGANLELLKLIANERLGFGLDYTNVFARDEHEFIATDFNLNYYSLMGSSYLKLPELGFDAALKVGRFIFGDVGYRFEVNRRFADANVAFWYSRTDFGD
ncbi:MAG: YjbH domain-containing protein, partial [Candidatus Margulisbacteria bacterium]|nr:YjbH domain-containing protein [Candidatus Margulisiibacteriota bacterium]